MEQLIAALPDILALLGGKIATIPEFLLLVGKYANLYVGIFMPLLVGIVTRNVSNHDFPVEIKGFRLFTLNFRFLITLALCMVMAVVLNITTVLGMGWDGREQILALWLYIFTQSQVVYSMWFKHSDLRQSIEKMKVSTIENQATN